MVTKIILADDHPLLIVGARVLIEKTGFAQVVGEAHDPDEIDALLSTLECDILVTDFSMPSKKLGDGLRMINHVRRNYPKVSIIVLTMITTPGILLAILREKVNGLLSKASLVEELPKALHAVCNHSNYVSTAIKESIGLDNYMHIDKSSQLSPRESEVIRLFATGMTGDQIALQLHRSKKTISRQKKSAMHKLGVTTDSEFFAYLRELEGNF